MKFKIGDKIYIRNTGITIGILKAISTSGRCYIEWKHDILKTNTNYSQEYVEYMINHGIWCIKHESALDTLMEILNEN